jgi:class 3 adenylate cyclase
VSLRRERSTHVPQSASTTLAERLERIMPDLSSGTVTFLFTDIAGSTALWDRDRVAHPGLERCKRRFVRRAGP